MYIVKVMKRKDASSIVVAVVIATAISMWLPSMLSKLANWISNVPNDQVFIYSMPDAGWQTIYLLPTVNFLLQILALELLLWAVIWLRPMAVRKGK